MLQAIRGGDGKASEELLPLVYNELRNLAAARMAQESAGQTLQATALVHEAWLRMIGAGDRRWQNRAHFLARRPRPCGVFWLIMRAINPD
jgi:DNA-directed RNA polymerase specialized sigma24 family protein